MTIRVTIDTCVINTRGEMAAMNTLERWFEDGLVTLQATTRLMIETAAWRGRPQASAKARRYEYVAEPFVLDVSFLDDGYLTDEGDGPEFVTIASVLFPDRYDRLSSNETNDVMHLMSHAFSKANYYVTTNTKDFIDGHRRDALAKLGIVVRTPDELIAELSKVFP